MEYDDIKHKTIAECYDLTIEELYLIFKQRYDEEDWKEQMKQWGSK